MPRAVSTAASAQPVTAVRNGAQFTIYLDGVAIQATTGGSATIGTDPVAAVTGAGSGIGRGIALALAQAGVHVAVADIDAAALIHRGKAGQHEGEKNGVYNDGSGELYPAPDLPDLFKAHCLSLLHPVIR